MNSNQFKLPFKYKYAILVGIIFTVITTIKLYSFYIFTERMTWYLFTRNLISDILDYMSWVFLLPVVYFFVKKFRIYSPAPFNERIKSFLVGFLITFIHHLIVTLMFFLPAHYMDIEPFTSKVYQFIISVFPGLFISQLIIYWIIYAFLTAIDFQNRFKKQQIELAKKEEQLSKAQMKALKLQLQPHFLYNTLNTISAVMEINIKGAQKIVSDFGSMMRKILDSNKQNFIPLKEEIQFTKSYLSIEEVRFNDRLKIHYQIDQDILNIFVPNLLLQPLVENAIKHGFYKQVSECNIEVIAQSTRECIQLIIKDDGTGTDLHTKKLLKTGIGLQNVKNRLQLIYNDDFVFKINSSKGNGFEVIISIPKRHKI